MKTVILDYGTGEVKIVSSNDININDIEETLGKRGLINSDCNWMIVDELEIVEI